MIINNLIYKHAKSCQNNQKTLATTQQNAKILQNTTIILLY